MAPITDRAARAQSRRRAARRSLALGVALTLAAGSASPIGFGRSATRSTLGQPLDFVAALSLDADEVEGSGCVGAEVVAGDTRVAPPNVRAVLERGPEATRRIRVTTSVPIDEPVVSIEISVGCGSRVARRFTSFIDPPGFGVAVAVAEAGPDGAPRVEPRVRLLADLARGADRARRRAAASDGQADAAAASSRRATRPALAAAARPVAADRVVRRSAERATTPAPRLALAEAARPGPRLRLEPAALPVAALAVATAASTPSAAPPAAPMLAVASTDAPPGGAAPPATADAAEVALQRERDRIQALEAGLARVRGEAQAAQQSVTTLQARLREAESARYPNLVVYALAALAVILAVLAYALWKLRPRQRRRAQWFEAQSRLPRHAAASDVAATAAAAASARAEPELPVRKVPSTVPSTHTALDSLLPTAPATIGGLEVTTVLGPMSTRAAIPVVDDALTPSPPRGELSMEELIDLEQQAEFFAVLGQEEAAIALLDGYVRGDGSQSPLPYLQLLELHQKRGDAVGYEEIGRAFKERFGGIAPDWTADLHLGRALDAYPQTVARLQALWPTPLSAMQTLDAMLFRRQASDETFDFPAYRELLFLYSIARELAGQVETDFGAIDLFLPLEDAPSLREPAMTPMEASWRGGAYPGPGIDVDVSQWPDDAAVADISAAPRRAAH